MLSRHDRPLGYVLMEIVVEFVTARFSGEAKRWSRAPLSNSVIRGLDGATDGGQKSERREVTLKAALGRCIPKEPS